MILFLIGVIAAIIKIFVGPPIYYIPIPGSGCRQWVDPFWRGCRICYQNTQKTFQLKSCITFKPCQSPSGGFCSGHRQQWVAQKTCQQYCCKDYENNNFDYFSLNRCLVNNNVASLPVRTQDNLIFFTIVLMLGSAVLLTFASGIVYHICEFLQSKGFSMTAFMNGNLVSPQINNQDNKKEQTLIWNKKQNYLNDTLNSLDEQLNQHMKNDCCICLEEYTNCYTSCKHYFHLGCLLKWISKNQSCPLCISTSYNPVKIQCQKCRMMQSECQIVKNTLIKNYKKRSRVISCDDCILKKQKEQQNQVNIVESQQSLGKIKFEPKRYENQTVIQVIQQ